MSMITFSRMCESIETSLPTRKKQVISSTLSSLSTTDKIAMIRILSLEYNNNNIGERKATKWLSSMLNVFEEEIIEEAEKWLDLGEGMLEFLNSNRSDSNITLQGFLTLLELDCSKMNSPAFNQIEDAIMSMSTLEVKWFIRYWLRTPRNGINVSTVEKSMSILYDMDVSKYSTSNTLSSMVMYLDNEKEPPEHVHGSYIKPMLAKPYKDKLPNRYIIDTKYDGNRYQIHKYDDIIIFNRTGKVVTEQYPDIVSIINGFDAKRFVIDCEIYPINKDGYPATHQKLGTRVHSKDKHKAVLECPVELVIFDCMSYLGNSQLNETYEVRLEIMKKFVPEQHQAKMFTHSNIEAAYNVAINGGFEGIMIKDLDAVYQSKRTSSLLKYKPPRIELDVVITSGEYGKGKRMGVIATYGVSVKNGSDYVSVGNVGTGISEEEMYSLDTKLKRYTDGFKGSSFGGTYYFLPRIVLEVICDTITQNQDGSYGMRFPRINRIRDDKHAADCNTLEDVRNYCSNI